MKTKTFAKITLATAAAIALTACGGGSSQNGSGDGYLIAVQGISVIPYDAPPISAEEKEKFLSAINNARSSGYDCGGEYGYMPPAPPVIWDNAQYLAAYEHSYDMAMTNNFSHTGSGTEYDWTHIANNTEKGSELHERLATNGVKANGALSENLVAGVYGIEDAVMAWLKSPSHCASLMSPSAAKVGVAYVENPASQYKIYWTQVFTD
jgi:uncharacterized protein YkwD